MAKAFWVTTYREIFDANKLAQYAKLALPAIEAGGGKFIVRGMPEKVYENGLMQRTVVIEFPDMATAIATHDSAAYQQALEALGDGADRDMRLIEGV
ncbi:MAG: DUF1330 domain-containing protein [Burkholderiaceae bacterium]